jgi:hypothetical protein
MNQSNQKLAEFIAEEGYVSKYKTEKKGIRFDELNLHIFGLEN